MAPGTSIGFPPGTQTKEELEAENLAEEARIAANEKRMQEMQASIAAMVAGNAVIQPPAPAPATAPAPTLAPAPATPTTTTPGTTTPAPAPAPTPAPAPALAPAPGRRRNPGTTAPGTPGVAPAAPIFTYTGPDATKPLEVSTHAEVRARAQAWTAFRTTEPKRDDPKYATNEPQYNRDLKDYKAALVPLKEAWENAQLAYATELLKRVPPIEGQIAVQTFLKDEVKFERNEKLNVAERVLKGINTYKEKWDAIGAPKPGDGKWDKAKNWLKRTTKGILSTAMIAGAYASTKPGSAVTYIGGRIATALSVGVLVEAGSQTLSGKNKFLNKLKVVLIGAGAVGVVTIGGIVIASGAGAALTASALMAGASAAGYSIGSSGVSTILNLITKGAASYGGEVVEGIEKKAKEKLVLNPTNLATMQAYKKDCNTALAFSQWKGLGQIISSTAVTVGTTETVMATSHYIHDQEMAEHKAEEREHAEQEKAKRHDSRYNPEEHEAKAETEKSFIDKIRSNLSALYDKVSGNGDGEAPRLKPGEPGYDTIAPLTPEQQEIQDFQDSIHPFERDLRIIAEQTDNATLDSLSKHPEQLNMFLEKELDLIHPDGPDGKTLNPLQVNAEQQLSLKESTWRDNGDHTASLIHKDGHEIVKVLPDGRVQVPGHEVKNIQIEAENIEKEIKSHAPKTQEEIVEEEAAKHVNHHKLLEEAKIEIAKARVVYESLLHDSNARAGEINSALENLRLAEMKAGYEEDVLIAAGEKITPREKYGGEIEDKLATGLENGTVIEDVEKGDGFTQTIKDLNKHVYTVDGKHELVEGAAPKWFTDELGKNPSAEDLAKFAEKLGVYNPDDPKHLDSLEMHKGDILEFDKDGNLVLTRGDEHVVIAKADDHGGYEKANWEEEMRNEKFIDTKDHREDFKPRHSVPHDTGDQSPYIAPKPVDYDERPGVNSPDLGPADGESYGHRMVKTSSEWDETKDDKYSDLKNRTDLDAEEAKILNTLNNEIEAALKTDPNLAAYMKSHPDIKAEELLNLTTKINYEFYRLTPDSIEKTKEQTQTNKNEDHSTPTKTKGFEDTKDYAKDHDYKFADDRLEEINKVYKQNINNIFNHQNHTHTWADLKDEPAIKYYRMEGEANSTNDAKFLAHFMDVAKEEIDVKPHKGTMFKPAETNQDFMLRALMEAEENGKLDKLTIRLEKIENLSSIGGYSVPSGGYGNNSGGYSTGEDLNNPHFGTSSGKNTPEVNNQKDLENPHFGESKEKADKSEELNNPHFGELKPKIGTEKTEQDLNNPHFGINNQKQESIKPEDDLDNPHLNKKD